MKKIIFLFSIFLISNSYAKGAYFIAAQYYSEDITSESFEDDSGSGYKLEAANRLSPNFSVGLFHTKSEISLADLGATTDRSIIGRLTGINLKFYPLNRFYIHYGYGRGELDIAGTNGGVKTIGDCSTGSNIYGAGLEIAMGRILFDVYYTAGRYYGSDISAEIEFARVGAGISFFLF